ncbi:MAG: DUF1015 domain-containing protein [Myxococcota bacterium]
MTEIKPFRAIRYNLDNLGADAAEQVVAPPYDVIDEDEQAAFYARHPNNVIRLILNRIEESDDGENNRYTRARRHLFDWLARGELAQDDDPGLYLHHQTFEDVEGNVHTRKGFLGLVRLAEYDEEVVLPHERTLRGPKIDRLELMKACESNMSPVFLLYEDPDREVDRLLEAAREAEVAMDVTTDDDIRHQLWSVFDGEAQCEVAGVLQGTQVLIADGHHRYETALAYRDFRRETAEEPVENAPYEYVMAFLVNIHDPGLQVFPTHRVIHDVEGFDYGELISELQKSNYFELRELPASLLEDPVELMSQLDQAGEDLPSFVFANGGETPYLVQFTGDKHAPVFDADTPDEVCELDVAVLHEAIIDRMIGVDKEAQEAKTNLRYMKQLDDAVDALDQDDVQLVAFMNPTPVDQVARVCKSGGKMPQKSTYFYPKILSGLTINPL